MRSRKNAYFAIFLIYALIFSPVEASAEERSIFIGDLIEIKITTQAFTEEDLREKFRGFEIVDLKTDKDGYIITLRSFEPGERVVTLGDKELIISVKSTLSEIDRTEAYEGDLSAEEPGFYIDFRYLFYALLIVFLLTGGICLYRYLKGRRASLNPYKLFVERTGGISLSRKDAFVWLTLFFKEYLEARFSVRIKGKTSSEIMNEICHIPELNDYIEAIREWFGESDFLKFSGYVATVERKQALLDRLVEIASQIERMKEVKA